MKKSFRIVVVGDQRVGKSSIIEGLKSATFKESLQPVLPVLVISKEFTSAGAQVSIVDTSNAEKHSNALENELNNAHAVVVVYDVNDDKSQTRVSEYWLKKFRSKGLSVPIILVGNKTDLREGIVNPSARAMETFINPIIDKHHEIEACIECSAKNMSNIAEVFYIAQKAVLFPSAPIYDIDKQELKPPVVAALKRIFKKCDKDGDGGLNDKELNDFQFKCFGLPLNADDMARLKKVAQQSVQEDGIRADGSLSVEGFIFLHQLSAQRGRMETTWIVLRKFGYDDSALMRLSDSQKIICRSDQSVELSMKGKQFLCKVFTDGDIDADGMLSPEEMNNVFDSYPDPPFSKLHQVNPSARLTRKGPEGQEEYVTLGAFLDRWTMYVQDSPNDALLALLYIGYADSPQSALRITKSRKKDRYNRTVSRRVLSVLLLGSNHAEQCDIIRGLVHHAPTGEATPGLAAAVTMKNPDDDSGKKRTVVLRENRNITPENLTSHKAALQSADVVCISFNATSKESFDTAYAFWTQLQSMKAKIKVPIIFAASVDAGEDVTVMQHADVLCLNAKVPTPVRVSNGNSSLLSTLYTELLHTAMNPDVACVDYYDSSMLSSTAIMHAAVGTLAMSGLLYCGKRLYDYWTIKPSN